jgi:DDE superfamily endonuclease
MVEDFDPQTKEIMAGCIQVLLLDGHSSHYTLPLLEYAWANNIIILRHPPHCTHVLQGLDVVCFAKMKLEFCCKIQSRSVVKADFALVFRQAFLRAFTPKTVKAPFKATGVHPFNPDVITEKQMVPSLPMSIKGTFPLPQTSPVHVIIAVMGFHPPTAFDLSPSHSMPVVVPSQTILNMPKTPTTITLRYQCNPNIDPELDETPSK